MVHLQLKRMGFFLPGVAFWSGYLLVRRRCIWSISLKRRKWSTGVRPHWFLEHHSADDTHIHGFTDAMLWTAILMALVPRVCFL